MLKALIYLLFFASGISGLVYEVIWIRKLTLIFGCTTYATSAVLTAFMGGLALGSFLLGRVADRQKDPLRLYGCIELAIGISTVVVMLLLLPVMDSVYVAAFRMVPGVEGQALSGAGPGIIAVRFILAIAILIVPTTLMGGTLPIISRFFVRRRSRLGMEIGNLYAINTVGAMFGCFMAGFVLIRSLGESITVALAVAINITVGLACILLSPHVRQTESDVEKHSTRIPLPSEVRTDTPIAASPSSITSASPAKVRTVLWAFGLAGFASLAYEVIWTRMLINVIGSDVYCFTVILTTFLLGITVGSFVFARFVDRLRRLYLTFGLAEIIIGCLALATIPLTSALPAVSEGVITLFRKEGLMETPFTLRTTAMFAAAFLIFIAPTFLMGAVFPVVYKIYHRGMQQVGRSVGDVYSVNTLGTILGASAAGFVILPVLGIAASIVTVSVINLAVGIGVLLLEERTRTVVAIRWLGIGAAGASLAAVLIGGHHTGVPGYFKEPRQALTIPYYRETPAATLYVKEYTRQRNIWGYPFRQLIINRHPTAHNSLLDIIVHKALAHIPVLIHEQPQKALVVGFGLGSTSYSMLRHAELSVDCVELLAEEIETAPFFERENHDIIHKEDRFRLIINDGRNYILATEEIYDVISVNAIDPRLSPALYTWDFYELCRRRMLANGVMALWLPTYGISKDSYFSIYKSFQDVFPHSFVVYCNQSHFLIVGSPSPVRIDLKRFLERASEPEVAASLAEVCLDDPQVLLSTFIMSPEGLREMVGGGRLNTDLDPTVEFDREEVPNPALNPHFFRAVLRHRGSVIPFLDAGPAAEEQRALRAVERFSDQLGLWMEGQLEFYTRSRPGGMARMIDVLQRHESNLFLDVLLVTYSPSELHAPYFNRSLLPFVSFCEDVLRAKPSMVMIHSYLGTAFAKTQELKKALQHTETMVNLRPDDWLFRFDLGGLYYKTRQPVEARACFESLLQTRHGQPGGLYGLAVIQADEGNLTGAEDFLQKALLHDPGFDKARHMLNKIQSHRGTTKRR